MYLYAVADPEFSVVSDDVEPLGGMDLRRGRISVKCMPNTKELGPTGEGDVHRKFLNVDPPQV